MLDAIIIAIIIAKFKKYKIAPLIKCWAIYPIVVLELTHIFCQITVFQGNYYFVQFAPIIKRVYMYTFLIPIIVYKLYKEGVIGSAFIVLGTALNNFAMNVNNGKMPVFPSLSYITGYVKEDTFSLVQDIHVLGTSDTNWSILCDVFDVGYSILSIGDIFIRLFAVIVIYNTIKRLQINRTKEK